MKKRFHKSGGKVVVSSIALATLLSGYQPVVSQALANEGSTSVASSIVIKSTSTIEVVSMSEFISGLHMKKLRLMGIIATELDVQQSKTYPFGNKVKIEKVQLVGPNLIAATFDRKLEKINVDDLIFTQNENPLDLKKAAVAENSKGQTVILYESAAPIQLESGNSKAKIYANVVKADSTDVNGNTLKLEEHRKLKDVTEEFSAIPNLLTVSKDGLADYSTVQGAIDAVPANNTEEVEIYIQNGVYKELVTIPKNKPFISLRGENASETVITYDNYNGKLKPNGSTYGTTGSASVYVYGDDFTAENITFENSFNEIENADVKNKQAVALYARGDRQSFIHSRFIGNQDTLYVNGGTQFFYQSYIEGDVDFIFGRSQAVFEECEIFSLDRGSTTNNGFVTAASTLIEEPYGYLFLNSKLLSNAPEGTVYLGRPWHPGGDPNAIGSVVFMNSYLGNHIHPQGWTDMSGFSYKDARFYEYKNYGPGAVINEDRRQLTDEEAENYTVGNVLKGWNPKEQQ